MFPVCFLDLDGVLVDFVGGAIAVHKGTLDPEDIDWGFWRQLCQTEEQFWKPMGKRFWSNLKWTSGGKLLVTGLESMFGPENIVLMTSPCSTPGSVEGKVEWIKRELPDYKFRFFVGTAKHLMASSTKILVDDHDGNVDKFVHAGGKAVLVPRPWNRRREICKVTSVNDILSEAREECRKCQT